MKNMKKLSLLLFTVITTVIFNSCSKEESKVNEPTTTAFTVYKNPTGDANADALQAQNTDSKGTLNFYGAFDSENNPSEIRTLTYQKANNDTIVNLIIDPLTNRLASSYFSVKGVKSPIIMKLDYIDNSKNINVSYYNYNWITETSNLIYASQIENNNGVVTENPFYASKKIALPTFLEGALALGTGLAVAETVGLVAGTFTLSAAAAPIIAGVLATQIVTYAAVGVAVFCISNLAGAATYTPSNLPPPSKTPIINPVTATSNPTQNLQISSCVNTNMTFRASMDFEGSIMITEVVGGQSPYTYMVSSGFQQSQVFPNQYKDGSYVVGIKDANGCLSYKLVSLKREIDCSNTSLKLTVEVNSNNASATVSGGMAPYKYLWSNGEVSQSVSNLLEGNYELKVTDAVGCEKVNKFSIAINCNTSSLAASVTTTNNNASATVSGGIAPYKYLWSNGAVSQSVSNLPVGIYELKVTDAVGCEKVSSFSIDFILTGFWRLNTYTNETRTSLAGSELINFQDRPGYGLPETYAGDNDFLYVPSFDISNLKLSIKHTYWNIHFYFSYNSSTPNKLIGESIGASNNGLDRELIKQ